MTTVWRKYMTLKQGETFVLEPGEYLVSRCCDCGLVHLVDLVAKRGKRVAVTTFRDDRKTAAGRRWGHTGLQQRGGVGPWRMRRRR